ncbi:MAG: STAS domain-containing protein [Planctomycetota bacterium]|nr:STAS domain-containing protein [Planctomycetota bacterium]
MEAAAIIVPPVEITEATLADFAQDLMGRLDDEGPGFVLDLERVTFIGSAGLGTLVKVGMRLDARGRRLALARAQRATEQTITLLGLDQVLPLFPTIEAARTYVAVAAAPGRI